MVCGDEYTASRLVQTASMDETPGPEGLMRRMSRGLLVAGILVISGLMMAGCGDDDGRSVGPGLIEIENRPTLNLSDPLLEVRYTRPGIPGTVFNVTILNDPLVSGDILYDPVVSPYYFPEMGQNFLLFGIDRADSHRPEYRAFLDFPLDGSTGQAAIPLDADIESAVLRVYVSWIGFFDTVPVLLDLVEYPLTGLEAFDFDSVPLATRSRFDIYIEDFEQFVDIEVSTLMERAQLEGLADFQVRFRVQ